MVNATRLGQFRQFLLRWYQDYGRHDLPWRQITDPYAILVSELMLQQTQVPRVLPKYHAFLARFPTLQSLAAVPLVEVLKLWQGLGYNRRAKFLWQLAQQVKVLPQTQAELIQLPGIGPYTAAAVCAFAYNQPVVLIETNVRTVFLHHFFPANAAVADSEVLPLIETALDTTQPRHWYSALMDYGTYLKSVLPNPSRRSKHHVTQTKFIGSVRQVRGEILRLLTQQAEGLGQAELFAQLKSNPVHHQTALDQLVAEGFVKEVAGQVWIA